MTPIEKVLRGLIVIDVWVVVKGFVLFGLLLYLVFAIVVIRQVHLMSKTLNGNLDLPLKLVARIHLALVGAVFLMAVLVL